LADIPCVEKIFAHENVYKSEYLHMVNIHNTSVKKKAFQAFG
jgi:hypothetical protein